MKKILICGQCMVGLEKVFKNKDFEVIHIEKISESHLDDLLENKIIEWVFTYNFEPGFAEICIKYSVVYLSWIVDWPHPHIYAKVANNSNIFIFIFDQIGYYEACARGMKNVFYLPLAADIDYFETVINSAEENTKKRFEADVSFMGNLYDAKEHNLYDRINYFPPLVKGYLDGIMNAQKKVWGYTFVKEAIRDEMWREIHKYIQWDLGDKYESVYEVLFERMLCEKIAQEERKEMCSLLAEKYQFKLYTKSNTEFDKNINNCGAIDYFHDMPILFNRSKINMNITLHSIKSGIPLRCLDIMACGGFLMSNYQAELAEYFVNGEELILWEDFDDMLRKIDYYLAHEEERKKIAEAGKKKVKQLFHYEILIEQMINQVESSMEV